VGYSSFFIATTPNNGMLHVVFTIQGASGATSGARTAYPSGAPEFTFGFKWGSFYSIFSFMYKLTPFIYIYIFILSIYLFIFHFTQYIMTHITLLLKQSCTIE
jgi:hypothetical protein